MRGSGHGFGSVEDSRLTKELSAVALSSPAPSPERWTVAALRIALVHASGDVEHLRGRIPINVSVWESTESFGEDKYFRVADFLLKEVTPEISLRNLKPRTRA